MDERTKSLALGCALGVLAAVSCGGITSTVETLRAQRIHIVGADDQVRLDVAAELHSLRERVSRLEATLASGQAAGR
jgi:hypothetical protein